MSATDELRRLLDERGVEWRAYTNLTNGAMELFHSTYFDTPNGCKARATSIVDSELVLITFRATPEQAIAATLGCGTCEWPTDMEGQRIQIADTIHMLRTEYDGDHEWEDVVIELVYVEHGGDKWVVRGARGEAWACECTVTGHDDELYENSGDWSNLPTPWDRPEPDGWYKCPNPSCGCVVGYSLLADDSWTIYMDDYQIPFNHCPQCGKVVCE